MCGLIFVSLPSPLLCAWRCVYERQRRGTEYMFDGEWEMLQQEADLYRLATHVHRGQSASSRKCVYKWGSYFYCFCHFTRSPSNRSLLYTSFSFFSGTSSYFSLHYCLPTASFLLNRETAEVSFVKFLSYLARFPGLHAPIGEFCVLVSSLSDTLSHGQIHGLCPPSHMASGQLSFD